jgi:hypothetical protein
MHMTMCVCETLTNRLLAPEHCTTCVTLVTIVCFFHVLVTAHQTARRHNPEDVSTSSELYYLWTSKNNQTEQIWHIDMLRNVTSSNFSVVTWIFINCDSEKR